MGAEVLSKLCGISMGVAQSARHQLMENGGSGHAKEEDHERSGKQTVALKLVDGDK